MARLDYYSFSAYQRALDAGWHWSEALRVLAIAAYFRDRPVPEGV
jgi:hypothetical protein